MINENTRGALKLSGGHPDQLAEPLAATQELAHHRADDDEHCGVLQTREEVRHSDGSLSCTRVCQRLAPMVLNSIRAFWSAASSRAAVPTITGKKAMKAARATLDAIPKPSHDTKKAQTQPSAWC